MLLISSRKLFSISRYLNSCLNECSWKKTQIEKKDNLRNSVLKISQYSQEIPVLESLFNNVAGLYSCKLIKKRLQQMCFSVNIAKFLRISLFIEYVCFCTLDNDSFCVLEILRTVNDFNFTVLVIEWCDALRKTPVIAAFAKWFRTTFSIKSYW